MITRNGIVLQLVVFYNHGRNTDSPNALHPKQQLNQWISHSERALKKAKSINRIMTTVFLDTPGISHQFSSRKVEEDNVFHPRQCSLIHLILCM